MHTWPACETAQGDRARRQLQVGVRHDHDRAGRAELERQLLHPGPGGDPLADPGRAGERHLPHPRVGHEHIAERAARAGQHRQHALGQPGVDEAPGQRQRSERGVAGRLEDDRVSGRQRRRDLVQDQQGGVVERGDRHDDPDRLPDGEADLVETGARIRVQRQGVAVELGALERGEPNQVTRAARLRRRLSDRFAVLGADRRGDLRRPLVGQLRCPQQDSHPLVGRRAPPDRRAAVRGCQGELDVRQSGGGHLPHDRPVIRRADLLGLAGPGGRPLAADQQLGGSQRSLLDGLVGQQFIFWTIPRCS
jgi:hypothetical protein